MPCTHWISALELAGATLDGRRSRGNPGLRKTQPEVIRWCAWRIDVYEAKPAELRPFVTGKLSDRSDARKLVRRYVGEGRKLLHDEGVLPWVLWASGASPQEWWRESRFLDAIDLWYIVYIERNRDALARVRECISLAADYARALEALSDARQKRGNENRPR